MSLSRMPLPALMVPLLVMLPSKVDIATDPGVVPVLPTKTPVPAALIVPALVMLPLKTEIPALRLNVPELVKATEPLTAIPRPGAPGPNGDVAPVTEIVPALTMAPPPEALVPNAVLVAFPFDTRMPVLAAVIVPLLLFTMSPSALLPVKLTLLPTEIPTAALMPPLLAISPAKSPTSPTLIPFGLPPNGPEAATEIVPLLLTSPVKVETPPSAIPTPVAVIAPLLVMPPSKLMADSTTIPVPAEMVPPV